MVIVISAGLIAMAAWLVWWVGHFTEDATAKPMRLAAFEIIQDEYERSKRC